MRRRIQALFFCMFGALLLMLLLLYKVVNLKEIRLMPQKLLPYYCARDHLIWPAEQIQLQIQIQIQIHIQTKIKIQLLTTLWGITFPDSLEIKQHASRKPKLFRQIKFDAPSYHIIIKYHYHHHKIIKTSWSREQFTQAKFDAPPLLHGTSCPLPHVQMIDGAKLVNEKRLLMQKY